MATEERGDSTVGTKRILLVDDHPIVRQGLAELIRREPGLEVCGEVGDACQVVKAIQETSPDMVVLDLSLQGTIRIDLLSAIQVRRPGLPVLVLSMHDENLCAERALRAGARGYVMKGEEGGELVAAVRKVLGGGVYLSEKMVAKLLRRVVPGAPPMGESPVERLSDRELQVFELIGHGTSTRQVAQTLHLSVKTIETHRAHIKDKLSLDSATDLFLYAFRWTQDEGRS